MQFNPLSTTDMHSTNYTIVSPKMSERRISNLPGRLDLTKVLLKVLHQRVFLMFYATRGYIDFGVLVLYAGSVSWELLLGSHTVVS